MKSKAERSRLREESEERINKWREITPEQQIASLKTRRGESKKQIDRIKKSIAESK